ncbi:hypothetical protein D3C72_640160 [compost metagenome]
MKAPSNRLAAACLAATLSGCLSAAPPSRAPAAPEPLAVHRAATPAIAPLVGRLSVDDVPDGGMRAGQHALWRFQFLDGPGRSPLTRFSIHHDKPMHLVVVSRDLSRFAHLHPALVADGTFQIQVNAPSSDPDNADAATAVSHPGTYFLFSEVAPAGRSATVTRFTVRTDGTEQPVPLTADPRSPSGEIVTHTAPPGRPAASYQVGLRLERAEHHPGMAMTHLVVTVRERDAEGRYQPVASLEPWLGMTGHAVLVGQAGDRVEDRVFRHLHASEGTSGGGHAHHVMQATGGRLTFMLMGEDEPPAGLYRLWVQVKHRGQVLTAPFTLTL